MPERSTHRDEMQANIYIFLTKLPSSVLALSNLNWDLHYNHWSHVVTTPTEPEFGLTRSPIRQAGTRTGTTSSTSHLNPIHRGFPDSRSLELNRWLQAVIFQTQRITNNTFSDVSLKATHRLLKPRSSHRVNDSHPVKEQAIHSRSLMGIMTSFLTMDGNHIVINLRMQRNNNMIPNINENHCMIPNPWRELISTEGGGGEGEEIIPMIWAAPIWEQGGYEILLLDSRPSMGIDRLFPGIDGNLKVIPFPRSMGTRMWFPTLNGNHGVIPDPWRES